MKVHQLELPGVLLIEPTVFVDARGHFKEVWSEQRYSESAGYRFVQDNVSVSHRGVIRGLHLQHPTAQAKLISVHHGRVFDVAVDVRLGSPTFSQWVGQELSAENHLQMVVPEGFAHGFSVLSEFALVAYKVSAPYSRADEIGIRYDDPELRIPWGVGQPVLSEKDQSLPLLSEAFDRLPRFS